MANLRDDTQSLIDHSVGFAEKMLTENQEFYPFAVMVNLDGELEMVSHFDGDDNPLSQDLINKLQPLLDKQIENKESRAYSLTYDAKVQKEGSSEKLDAVAVRVRHIETQEVTVYYFAYRLTAQKEVEHIDSWGEVIVR